MKTLMLPIKRFVYKAIITSATVWYHTVCGNIELQSALSLEKGAFSLPLKKGFRLSMSSSILTCLVFFRFWATFFRIETLFPIPSISLIFSVDT